MSIFWPRFLSKTHFALFSDFLSRKWTRNRVHFLDTFLARVFDSKMPKTWNQRRHFRHQFGTVFDINLDHISGFILGAFLNSFCPTFDSFSGREFGPNFEFHFAPKFQPNLTFSRTDLHDAPRFTRFFATTYQLEAQSSTAPHVYPTSESFLTHTPTQKRSLKSQNSFSATLAQHGTKQIRQDLMSHTLPHTAWHKPVPKTMSAIRTKNNTFFYRAPLDRQSNNHLSPNWKQTNDYSTSWKVNSIQNRIWLPSTSLLQLRRPPRFDVKDLLPRNAPLQGNTKSIDETTQPASQNAQADPATKSRQPHTWHLNYCSLRMTAQNSSCVSPRCCRPSKIWPVFWSKLFMFPNKWTDWQNLHTNQHTLPTNTQTHTHKPTKSQLRHQKQQTDKSGRVFHVLINSPLLLIIFLSCFPKEKSKTVSETRNERRAKAKSKSRSRLSPLAANTNNWTDIQADSKTESKSKAKPPSKEALTHFFTHEFNIVVFLAMFLVQFAFMHSAPHDSVTQTLTRSHSSFALATSCACCFSCSDAHKMWSKIHCKVEPFHDPQNSAFHDTAFFLSRIQNPKTHNPLNETSIKFPTRDVPTHFTHLNTSIIQRKRVTIDQTMKSKTVFLQNSSQTYTCSPTILYFPSILQYDFHACEELQKTRMKPQCNRRARSALWNFVCAKITPEAFRWHPAIICKIFVAPNFTFMMH